MEQQPPALGMQEINEGPCHHQVVQHPAGPNIVQPRPAVPSNLHQETASPRGMQQPQGVWGSGTQQCQPGPGQKVIQTHNVSKAAQRLPTMAQRRFAPQLPRRKALHPPSCKAAGGDGTLGRAIRLSVNHFSVTVTTKLIYHYEVDVEPAPSPTVLKKVVGQFLEGDARFNNIFPVFDLNKNIYTARRIPGLDAKIEIKFEFKEMDRDTPRLNEFTITLQPTEELEIDLSAIDGYCEGGTSVPLRPIQALDIALKFGAASSESKVIIGNKVLTKPVGISGGIGGGVEVWFGHFQSFYLGWKPFLIIDLTQCAIVKSGNEKENELKNYGEIEWKECTQRLNNIQNSTMIRNASTLFTPTKIYKENISEALSNMQLEWAKSFGVSVNKRMTKIKGRVLSTPKLVYGDNDAPSTTAEGDICKTNKKFLEPKSIDCYGVINMSGCNPRQLKIFIDLLTKTAHEKGMLMREPVFTKARKLRNLEKLMETIKEKHSNLQVLLIITKCSEGNRVYETTKRVGDLRLNLLTQCVEYDYENGPDPTKIATCVLKLNAQLGGVNAALSFEFSPHILLNHHFMIIGAYIKPYVEDTRLIGNDNPHSDIYGKFCIAALVGSVDSRASKYNCEIKIQEAKLDYVEDMENMVYNLLVKFNRASGATTGKPDRIILYRVVDKEDQFQKFQDLEQAAITVACERLEVGFRPLITIISVNHRHHTLLFPDKETDECGVNKCVPPGTCVDRMIVRPGSQDFFLVSQAPAAVNHPSHYQILLDENKFSPQELQTLTYHLCQEFTIPCVSIAFPVACAYARYAANRGIMYFKSLTEKGDKGPFKLSSVADIQESIDSTRAMNAMFFV